MERLHADLADFTGDVFGSLTRAGWQDRAGQYLHGLMLDGRRKSIQPMAGRLPGVHDQALNHFVTNSPWDVTPVRRRLALRMDEVITPAAWALDDTGWLKCGTASPGVARQYTGTAGKVTNCQIGVSLNLVTDTASCPVDWRLFLPESWDPASPAAVADVGRRRARAGIPDDVGHREKWRLGLDMIDEAIGWGMRPPLIVADAGYGDSGEFRHGLAERGLSYVVQVATTIGVYPGVAFPFDIAAILNPTALARRVESLAHAARRNDEPTEDNDDKVRTVVSGDWTALFDTDGDRKLRWLGGPLDPTLVTQPATYHDNDDNRSAGLVPADRARPDVSGPSPAVVPARHDPIAIPPYVAITPEPAGSETANGTQVSVAKVLPEASPAASAGASSASPGAGPTAQRNVKPGYATFDLTINAPDCRAPMCNWTVTITNSGTAPGTGILYAQATPGMTQVNIPVNLPVGGTFTTPPMVFPNPYSRQPRRRTFSGWTPLPTSATRASRTETSQSTSGATQAMLSAPTSGCPTDGSADTEHGRNQLSALDGHLATLDNGMVPRGLLRRSRRRAGQPGASRGEWRTPQLVPKADTRGRTRSRWRVAGQPWDPIDRVTGRRVRSSPGRSATYYPLRRSQSWCSDSHYPAELLPFHLRRCAGGRRSSPSSSGPASFCRGKTRYSPPPTTPTYSDLQA
ncbi:IS701 family transposase [Micromonospora zhanjiangensis]|uniref:IS701 family transposase n=1 Tax=Micromonospora zhanjiangensis TaxID=1522057 RepID=A0ABV8KW04_9ACTN